jgi:hypothetical protein
MPQNPYGQLAVIGSSMVWAVGDPDDSLCERAMAGVAARNLVRRFSDRYEGIRQILPQRRHI